MTKKHESEEMDMNEAYNKMTPAEKVLFDKKCEMLGEMTRANNQLKILKAKTKYSTSEEDITEMKRLQKIITDYGAFIMTT